jgi:hypothetical protein
MSQPSEYKNKFAISQSSIKDWRILSPKAWYNKWILNIRPKTTSEEMEFGNLLDTLIFNPELFEKRFILSEVAKPSDNIVLITRSVFDHITELNKNAKELNDKTDVEIRNRDAQDGNLYPDEIAKIVRIKKYDLTENKDIVKKFCTEHEFWVNNLERGYNDVVKSGSEFFDFLTKVGNKIVIDSDQLALAKELAEILKTDPISRGFFIAKKDCEVLFQQQIFTEFELSGLDNLELLPMKGMLDIIHINHKRKEIREVDLKYTNNTFLFPDAIRRFDYPLQHSIYDFLLHAWIKTYKKGQYSDYSIMNPLNVVIDDQEKIPYLYGYKGSDLQIKRSGMEGTRITGWEQTLEEIAWHIDTNQWERPRSHYLNGFIAVEVFSKR